MKQIVQFIEDNNSQEEVAKQPICLCVILEGKFIPRIVRKRVLCLFLQIIIISPLIRFFDQMYNQPVNLEGLTWTQVQDIMKLIHPELFTDIKRSSKFKNFEYK